METAWSRELLKTRFYGSTARWGEWMDYRKERAAPRCSWSQPWSRREGERREGNKLLKSPSLSAVPHDNKHSEALGMASWSGEQERVVDF